VYSPANITCHAPCCSGTIARHADPHTRQTRNTIWLHFFGGMPRKNGAQRSYLVPESQQQACGAPCAVHPGRQPGTGRRLTRACRSQWERKYVRKYTLARPLPTP
jgi:hypothetical protein